MERVGDQGLTAGRIYNHSQQVGIESELHVFQKMIEPVDARIETSLSIDSTRASTTSTASCASVGIRPGHRLNNLAHVSQHGYY